MADLLGSAITGSSSQTQSDKLVDAYKQAQQSRLDVISSKQSDLQTKQNFYNSLQTKLTTLQSEIDTFEASDAMDLFTTRTTKSSDDTVVSATTKGSASIGVATMSVSRLATNDTLISNRMTLADKIGVAQGTYKFKITADSDTKEISVNLDGTETNETAMQKIVKAVNSTLDIKGSAAFIQDTSKTAKLTFTSNDTGGDAKVTIDTEGSSGALFDALGLTSSVLSDGDARTVATATTAGYRTAAAEDLNAAFKINGIDVQRGSNTFDDVLPGMTITLNKAQEATDQPITLSTTVNTDQLVKNIQPLLDAYNDLVTYLKSDTTVSRSESSISSLYSTVRSLSSSKVTSAASSDDPNYLSGMGIKIKTDGTLYVSDKDTITDLLQEDPTKIYNLFSSSDGFVEKIKNAIQNYTGSSGIVTQRTLNISSQIKETQTKYNNTSDQIDKESDNLRKEYESMEQTYLEAQSQYSSFSALSSGYSSSSSSLLSSYYSS